MATRIGALDMLNLQSDDETLLETAEWLKNK
jgi:hypothetical protein